jgi:ribose transport system ATP-binding protein
MELHPFIPDRAVEAFSGGNQQKVLLGRSLTRDVTVYAFDEPTVGVDVGTRASIYRFIKGLCEGGSAVILISSDLPEITNLSHRAYVFAGGRVQAELAKDELSEDRVLPHFFARSSIKSQ